MPAPVLCFALKLMRIPMKPLLPLLLAVLLPLRGFTSATHCESPGQGHGAHPSYGIETALRSDTAHNDVPRQAAEAPHCADGRSPHPAENKGPHAADGLVPHQGDDKGPHAADGLVPHQGDDKGPHHTETKCPSHGDCCGCVAAVFTAPRFTVPRAAAALIVGQLTRPHPPLSLDRLDRPPRLPACWEPV
jgi:hypothetical protein